MCGCECSISAKIMHFSLSTWRVFYLKKIKDHSHNENNRSPVTIKSCICETYKNTIMPHVIHIQETESYMYMKKQYTFIYDKHVLPHWKGVLRCYTKFPSIIIPGK